MFGTVLRKLNKYRHNIDIILYYRTDHLNYNIQGYKYLAAIILKTIWKERVKSHDNIKSEKYLRL